LDVDDAPNQLYRWSRPAVDLLVFLTFAVHGLLLLSQRYNWFSFKIYVGRAVLVDVTVTVIALLLVLICVGSAVLMRYPFQFSLRSLSLLVISVAVTSTWFGVEVKLERREYEVGMAIQQAGGKAGGPHTALSRLLNDKRLVVLENVEIGDKYKSSFNDMDLLQLAGLRQLTRLSIFHGAVTDEGLKNLRDHHYLTALVLVDMSITDAGMVHLAGLRSLQYLSLESTQVGDDGLRLLRGLDKLETLNLAHTRVTNHGASEFSRAVPGCDVIHW
jgi:hypothetical protein